MGEQQQRERRRLAASHTSVSQRYPQRLSVEPVESQVRNVRVGRQGDGQRLVRSWIEHAHERQHPGLSGLPADGGIGKSLECRISRDIHHAPLGRREDLQVSESRGNSMITSWATRGASPRKSISQAMALDRSDHCWIACSGKPSRFELPTTRLPRRCQASSATLAPRPPRST